MEWLIVSFWQRIAHDNFTHFRHSHIFFYSFFTTDMNDMVMEQHHQYTDDTDWFDNSFILLEI